MNRFVKYIFILSAGLILNPAKVNHVLAQDDLDYKAYSLFVYNFMKYIKWPNANSDFILGVLGDSPVLKELQTLAKTKKAKGKAIILKTITTADEAVSCNLVYICTSKSSMLKTLIEKTKGKPVLLVGEREGLAKKGPG